MPLQHKQAYKRRSVSLLLAMLLAWSLTTSCFAAANNSSAVYVTDPTTQPASILVLTADGKPDKIYGNKNIDWTAIGLENDALELTDYEKFVLDYRSKDHMLPQEKAVARCTDYHLVDTNYDPWQVVTVAKFISMLCRSLFREQYDYLARNGYDDITVIQMIGRSKSFLPEGNWYNDPNAYLLNETLAIDIVQKILISTNHATISATKIVPRKVQLGHVYEIIAKLLDTVKPPEALDKLVYGPIPVVPIIICPQNNQVDDYHDFRGTSWAILNNGRNLTGYLSNGKPINEENIQELLKLAEQIFPEGTLWTSEKQKSGAPGLIKTTNNNYASPSSEMKSLYLTRYNVSPKTACGGFASFLSDLLFGVNANPVRKIDATHLHPGDIQIELNLDAILAMQFNTVTHTTLLTSVDNRINRTDFAEGNKYMHVSWNEWRQHMYPLRSTTTPETTEVESEFVYYTRWPA